MLGRLHHLIIDCPDPRALAQFYSALLGQPITYDSGDFVVVAANETTSGLGFQLSPQQRPSTWPDAAVPQQMHLDVMVENVAAATPHVLALGASRLGAGRLDASRLDAGRLEGRHVFADPAGHPFCLVRRPGWAEPLTG